MSTPEFHPSDVLPRAEWFRHERFGMFIHWGIYSLHANGEWCLKHDGIPYDEYRRYAERFDPVDFDADEWAAIAQAAGMRYMVFTTKHHDGFCMFDNPYTEWKITNTPFKRDVTRELADACRASDLRFGMYHSLIDWMHPDYTPDSVYPAQGLDQFSDRDQQRYATYLHQSVRYLLSRYGDVPILWLDFTPGGKGPADWRAQELMDIVREHQPNALVDDRLGDHDLFPGDFTTPEQVLPSGPCWAGDKRRVWEACVTMNGHWGYASADVNFKPTRTLVHMLARCVAGDGNLLLNVGPDAHGRIPQQSVDRLIEVGDWLAANGDAIYGATWETELTPPPGCVYTRNGDRLFLHVLEWPYMALRLPGLAGRLKYATLIKDGSRVRTSDWQSTSSDVTISLPFHEPDPNCTVIELEVDW